MSAGREEVVLMCRRTIELDATSQQPARRRRQLGEHHRLTKLGIRFEKKRSPLPLGAACNPCLPDDEAPASIRSASSCRLRWADICHGTARRGSRGGRAASEGRPAAPPQRSWRRRAAGSGQRRCGPSGLTQQSNEQCTCSTCSDDYAGDGSARQAHFFLLGSCECVSGLLGGYKGLQVSRNAVATSCNSCQTRFHRRSGQVTPREQALVLAIGLAPGHLRSAINQHTPEQPIPAPDVSSHNPTLPFAAGGLAATLAFCIVYRYRSGSIERPLAPGQPPEVLPAAAATAALPPAAHPPRCGSQPQTASCSRSWQPPHLS